jgi:hypothetical protein
VTTETLFTILTCAFGVIGLSSWWLWLQADYLQDSFRQKVFTLRDELFDYAASGKVSFDDPAYRHLRLLMNRVIRYTHRISFWQLIGVSIFESITDEDRMRAESFMGEWTAAVDRIADLQVRENLRSFEGRLVKLLMERVLTGSLIVLVLLTIATLAVAGFRVQKSALDLLARLIRPRDIEDCAWNHTR